MTRKLIICTLFAAAMLVCCAYAAEEGEANEIPEHTEEVNELGVLTATPPPAPIETPDYTAVPDDSSGNGAVLPAAETVEPEVTAAPDPVPTPETTHRVFTLMPEAYAEETPEPTAEAETEKEENELDALDILTGIYGCMIFFVVVILCFFGYKFFAMFFHD